MIELFHGDCLEKMKELPDHSIDAVMCDPPYGTVNCKWDEIIPLDKMWEQLHRITKPTANIVLFSSQQFTFVLGSSNIENFRQHLVWCKNKSSGHLNAKKRHMLKHEDILLFSRKVGCYNPQKSVDHKPMNYAKNKTSEVYNKYNETVCETGTTSRYPSSLLEFSVVNNDSKERVHPTQKPIELMEYLVETYSLEGETILDFTMGSGSTGVACRNLNRKFIGIEKDEKYFEIAKSRIFPPDGFDFA